MNIFLRRSGREAIHTHAPRPLGLAQTVHVGTGGTAGRYDAHMPPLWDARLRTQGGRAAAEPVLDLPGLNPPPPTQRRPNASQRPNANGSNQSQRASSKPSGTMTS